MDTILSCKNFEIYNLIEKALCFSVILVVVCIQAMVLPQKIMADDIIVAHNAVQSVDIKSIKEKILMEISPELRKKKFDEYIKEKYPKAIISEVQDGVKHIKLTNYYNGRPVRINVVEADLKVASNIQIQPVLSNSANLQSRRSISSMAKNNNIIAAVNGTYFKPQTGVPLGTLMINQKMYTGPIYDRVAMGIFDDSFDIARIQLDATVKGSGKTIKVNNINQPRMLSTHVLVYTPEWGKYSPAAPKYGVGLQVIDNKITKASANAIEIPENGYVISGPKSILYNLLDKKDVDLSIKTNPDWDGVKHIISGGPYLVKNGEVFVDMTAQKLQAIGGRNPRSAIGYTKDNNFIFVAVDGREGSSIGMTLMELANFMQSIGCVGAINLDGGGSTVMYVNGRVVNKPQQTGGIPLSNAIILSKTNQS